MRDSRQPGTPHLVSDFGSGLAGALKNVDGSLELALGERLRRNLEKASDEIDD